TTVFRTQPLEVAAILTDLKLDDATIVAALLHDTIEDTEATRAEIDRLFGPEIGALVEGLTKLKRLELVSREAKKAENLRKLLLAIADRSEEHTSELQSHLNLVCRLLLEKKNNSNAGAVCLLW